MKLRGRITPSIRVHLTLWYVVTLGVVLGLSAYAVNLTTGRLFELELDDALRAESQTLATAYDPGSAQIPSESLSTVRNEGWLFVLLNAQGDVTQYGGPLGEGEIERLKNAAFRIR